MVPTIPTNHHGHGQSYGTGLLHFNGYLQFIPVHFQPDYAYGLSTHVVTYWCRFLGPHPRKNLQKMVKRKVISNEFQSSINYKTVSTSPVVVRSETNVTDYFK
ncbi:hypothetical protein ACFX2I_015856 [Malus domestica]